MTKQTGAGKYILLLIALCISLLANAEIVEPIHWQVKSSKSTNNTHTIELQATIDAGWHLYDTDIEEGGPKPTLFNIFSEGEEIAPISILTNKEPIVEYDPNFEMDLRYYENDVTFLIELPKSTQITGSVEYMACNDQMCLPPSEWQFEISSVAEDRSDYSLIYIFLMGLLAGLLAIFTPCVWPIIPMTVSFFIKRSDSKQAIRDAIVYGLSIIVIYVGLGLLVTLIFGASALNDLSTNAVVNLIFFALLVLFALSFFGAFEITLPSSWSTKINQKAHSTSGILSILFMAFTLVIVSFSCTGPIIGTLLVEIGQSSLLAPTVGMFGFALALAAPFAMFALFPKWLTRLPKSGSWMDSFKVVLAFLELALSLKFLSVADLAYGWHILDREVFISLWIVIFLLLGLYLLGVFRFKHEQPREGISVLRFSLAVVSLSFSIYMLPGLWGAPLKAISAFAPPIYTQDFIMGNSTEENHHNFNNDIESALQQAQQEGKRVMLDFSGYGCVNCRKMEAKVFTDSRVQEIFKRDYIILTLMVDDKNKLGEPIEVEENGKTIKLKTVGDKNSYIQRSRYGANAQPLYVKLDSNGNQIGQTYSYNEDIEGFIDWLSQ